MKRERKMLKSMNRKFLIYAILYGVFFGWLMFRAIESRGEEITIRPDSEGEYGEVIEEEGFRVEVKDYGSGVINISFEPRVTWWDYFLGTVVGLLFGISHYECLVNQKKKKEEAETEQDDFMAGDLVSPEYDDPEYQAFVSEDENRQLFPRPVLEEDFQKWRESRRKKEAGES